MDPERRQAKADFDEGMRMLELAVLAIGCASNCDQVEKGVDRARQALQIVLSNAEVMQYGNP